MKRILVRAGKSPFSVLSAKKSHDQNIFGTNCGNLAFGNAVFKLLSAPGVELHANGFYSDIGEADRINEEYDVFVVPLANAFRYSFLPELEELTGLIRQLKIPVVILGVGAQSGVDYDLGLLAPMNEQVRSFVSAALDHSHSVGVRGEFTFDYLKSLGFSDVEVIGCPSMFYDGPTIEVSKKTEHLQYSDPVSCNISPYLSSIIDFFTEQARLFHDLKYLAQDRETLKLLLWGESPWESPESPDKIHSMGHPLIRDGKTLFFLDPTPWMEFLRTRYFSFGTRIHGNIVSLLAGTPAFVLVHDSRTLEIVRYFDIPYKLAKDVSLNDDVRLYHDTADYGPLMKNHPVRFAVFSSFLAKHGLKTVFDYPEEAAAFDRRTAEIPYPAAVGIPSLSHRNSLVYRLKQLYAFSIKKRFMKYLGKNYKKSKLIRRLYRPGTLRH